MKTILTVGMENFWYLILLLILFIMILGGAYFTTKFLSKIQYQQNKHKNMQIIEGLRLGNNKAIYLIKIGERYFAVSTAKEQVSLIAEFNDGEIKNYKELMNEKSVNISFKESLEKVIKSGKKK
ncbi:flagellar biogenesis protein FliO [Natranaerovirga pectinivora]|uniref:Flagellar biogenesis protein FliO n=1 Tax=Natranaerovirga pectinivora TaxID=682400 RepID=A0A4R3MR64_9FIRM|nr:flagellar biosynthetic protein FliO [Natranaerovirga pectinivora]TCT16436.1 flagellar biogenesis protein FliO [Natranaerovirga pectinivora]